MIFICGNRNLLQYATNYYYQSYDKEQVETIEVKEDIQKHSFSEKDRIYLVIGWTHTQEWLAELFSCGAEKAYIVPVFSMWYQLSPESGDHIQEVSKDTLLFKYLETHIADTCNLKCRGCMHFSNLDREPRFPDLEKFEKDIARLKELFPIILIVRLLGGEPLLNPKADLYAKIVRKYYPSAEIRIVTNGLLIPKVKETVWEGLRESRTAFDISPYPPTIENAPALAQILEREGIPCGGFGEAMQSFRKSLVEKPHDNLEEAARICGSSHCRTLKNGKIAKCPMPFQIETFNKQYNRNIVSNDIFDIYEEQNTAELKKKLDDYCDMCRFCPDHEAFLPWGVADHRTAKPEDWFAD